MDGFPLEQKSLINGHDFKIIDIKIRKGVEGK